MTINTDNGDKMKARSIQTEIYSRIPAGPLTVEALAKALADFLPDKPIEEIEVICAQLHAGLGEGMELFDEMHALEDDERSQAYAKKLSAALEQLPEGERKGRLVSLYQALCAMGGEALSSHELAYASAADMDELLGEVVFHITKVGEIAGVRMLEKLDQNTEAYQSDAPIPVDAFTAEEHMWIASAAEYVAESEESKEREGMQVEPQNVGRRMGVLGRMMQSIKRFISSRYALPGVVGVASFGAGLSMLLPALQDVTYAEKALQMAMVYGFDIDVDLAISVITRGWELLTPAVGFMVIGGLLVGYVAFNAIKAIKERREQMKEQAELAAYSANENSAPVCEGVEFKTGELGEANSGEFVMI